MPAIDVTDQTFQTEVIDRSKSVPVVIDLWAEWCGPCKTLGPILEKVIDETDGQVVLAKLDTEANPQITEALKVQSIPAVWVAKDGRLHAAFVGAVPEEHVRKFVQTLLPTEAEQRIAALVAKGDEASLREVLELDPGHTGAVIGLADLLVVTGTPEAMEEALGLLERIPESADTRRVAALARLGGGPDPETVDHDVEATLDGLLPKVKDDAEARQAFVDLLEVLGPEDPRTARYRKQLTSRLF